MTQTVRIEDVHYAYPPAIQGAAPVPALRGVDLAVEAGEFLALMGPTGAGKTTLCLTLNGLVPQSTGGRFRGAVWIAGRSTTKLPVAEFAPQVGMVFQDSESQLFNMTVEDEVAFGPESLGLSIEEIERRIHWALEVVGLAHLRARSPHHLSGGQQRRLAIASVLAIKPPILVLDEPTTGLDPLGRRTVLEVIAGLQQQGTTVIMATQDADAVAAVADRVAVLEAGRIVMQGAAQDILGQVDALHALGLEAPPMAELSRYLGIHPPCLTVDQAVRALSDRQSDDLGCGDASRTAAGPQTGTSPSNQPIITFEGVRYQYQAGAQALAGVDLSISPGEFVALIGANGSGKTTLAKHVNGLLRPQQGRVVVYGSDTQEKSTGELARWVGYVFQNPDHQIFAPSVREEIAFGPRNLGLNRVEVEERVEAALAAFDLGAVADLPPAALGYGQRRLVALAGVHAMAPRVLVLDEPTVGLDRRLVNRMVAWLSELHQAGGTVVWITHDMRHASLATRCVVMNHGHVALDGQPAGVFEHTERLAQAGIVASPFVALSHRLGLPTPALDVEGFQRYARFAPEESAV